MLAARHVVAASIATMIAVVEEVVTEVTAVEVVAAMKTPTVGDRGTMTVNVALMGAATTMALEASIATHLEVAMTATAAVAMTTVAAATTASGTATVDAVTETHLRGKLVNPMLEVETKITVLMIGTPEGRGLR